MIAVVDTGVGNLRSVVRALEAARGLRARGGASADAGDAVEITANPDVVRRADRVVMPGQGAFGDCTRALDAAGGALGQAVTEAIRSGRDYLGICLGLQVLFGESEEAPGCTGLGIFPGRVARFAPDLAAADGGSLKVPHVGWNRVEAATRSPVLRDREWFYFVHSYVVVPDDPAVVAGRTDHGGWFTSAVARDNVLAVQFHPEKSQRAGLDLLARWLDGATA